MGGRTKGKAVIRVDCELTRSEHLQLQVNQCLEIDAVLVLVSRTGIEPVTCRLGGGRSILLSYRDVSCA